MGTSPWVLSKNCTKCAVSFRSASSWKNASDTPDWLNEKTYSEKIQPLLAGVTVPAISKELGISEPYATDIRKGKRRPHPRHWLTLAELVKVSP